MERMVVRLVQLLAVLDIADVDRANAFMARPESQEMGVKSGVIDGEFHYIESVPIDG